MKRLLFFIPLIISIIIGFFSIWSLLSGRDPASIPSVFINSSVPNFELKSIPGVDILGLSKKDIDYSNRLTVVNFFASWCLPCRAEHKSLNKLSKNKDIFLVGINYKDTAVDVKSWLTELGNPYEKIGFDNSGRTGIDWGISGVPETFIIDKGGIIIKRFTGPIIGTNYKDFEKLLMDHLNED